MGSRSRYANSGKHLALIRLIHDLGLRNGAVVILDLVDIDLETKTVAVIGTGKSERMPLTLNTPAAAALADWIAARGDWAVALFVRLDRAAARPTRLDAGNVAQTSHALGRRAGVARGTNPHGLRHQGITRALDLAGGDVRRVRRFSRHAKLETVLRSDDNRRDEAGAIAHLLGEDSARTELGPEAVEATRQAVPRPPRDDLGTDSGDESPTV